ncbi:MAG TPA: hypothetical protein VK071_12660 [Tissierellales bacterium]|nr:hypothetical protein [Tissierellales bacterium]
MRRLSLILISVFLILVLTSCGIENVENFEKIAAPNNITPPITGEWKVEKYKIGNGTNILDKDIEKFMGKKVFFYNDIVGVEDRFSLEPTYKVKNVNASDYLFYHYKINPEFLEIEDEQIQIISIASKEQLYYEIIKKDDKNIIINIEGVFFFLSKLSDEVDTKVIEKYKREREEIPGGSLKESDDILRTGLLLGLRYYNQETENKDEGPWKYRTIWIHSHNKSLKDIYEIENILLPRKTGFWKVVTDNNIYAYPYTKEHLDKSIKLQSEVDFDTQIIRYVGNDYISIENIESNAKGRANLQTYIIDNFDSRKPIKISDVGGENLKAAFLEGAGKGKALSKVKKDNEIKRKNNEENFGLTRKNGHWILKGRISYEENGKQDFTDFNIKAVPPMELVYYDELSIPWNGIKMKIPEVIDAYTSPNDDIAVIITHKYMAIYPINNGELAKEPLGKVSLNSDEEVVMAEWAIGRYVNVWEDVFLKNDVKEIETLE